MRHSLLLEFSTIWIFGAVLANNALACDPCTLSTLTTKSLLTPDTIGLSVSESTTTYDSSSDAPAQQEGEARVTNYSTVNVGASYDVTARLGLRLSLPFSYIEADRRTEGGMQGRSDSGLGDIVVGAYYRPVSHISGDTAIFISLFGGLKLPTGNTGALAPQTGGESETDGEAAGADDHRDSLSRARYLNHPVGSPAGGRLLVLGTGSLDIPIGASVFVRHERLFLSGAAQYTFRTDGAYGYHFANDVTWNFGPGVDAYISETVAMGLRAVLSGESKGLDGRSGEFVDASAAENVYLGPEIYLSTTQNLSVELGVDLPVSTSDARSTIVPDIRYRIGAIYRF